MGRRATMLALLGIGGAVGALAAREALQRRRDGQDLERGRDYWRLALPAAEVRWADAHGQSHRIPSGAVGLNLDVFARPERAAPVVVIVHGLLTYGRCFLPLARRCFEHGYSVVCVDLPGSGLSGGVRGATPAGEAAAALVDATVWARQRFDGPVFLVGASLGGAVAYAAAAAGAPIAALACLDLFTFDDPATLRALVAQPRLIDLLPLWRALAVVFGWVRLPVTALHRMDAVVAPDEAAQLAAWQFDPLPPRQITLRALVSAATTPPRIALEHNTIPVLVLNQTGDQVIPPAATRASFERLGGPKRYVELPDAAHWSFNPAFWDALVAACDAWFRQFQPRMGYERQTSRVSGS